MIRALRRATVLGLAALAAAGGLGLRQASASAESFRYERPAVLHEPGPQSLVVDVPLLVGSAPFHVQTWPGPRGTPARRVARGGLSDLRFYDPVGREVPYLLVEPPATEPEWRRAGTLLPIPQTKTTSGFEADLGVATTVDRLKVEGLQAPFLKRLALDGSGDRERWTRLAPQATLFDLPDSGLRQVELSFPPGLFRYLRVTWDDTSSARVPLPRGATARAVRADAPLRPALSAPVVFARRASEPGTSRFRLRLAAPSLPVVALRLTIGGGNLMRRARRQRGAARRRLHGALPAGRSDAAAGGARRADRGRAAGSDRAARDRRARARGRRRRQPAARPAGGRRGARRAAVDLPRGRGASVPGRPLGPARPRRSPLRPRIGARAGGCSRQRHPPAPGASRAAPLRRAGPMEAPAALPPAGPALDTTAFRYTRTLADGPSGLVAVPLDAAVLAHSSGRLRGDFADLRVVDAASRQLPYLLDRRAEPLVVALPPAVPAGETVARFGPNTSVYRLRLPYAALPPSRLVLRTSARVFDREVRVLVEPVPGERRKRDAAQVVAAATWRHAQTDAAAPALTLALPTLATAEVLLAVVEGDNPPLPLAAPDLLLPSWHVRLFRGAPGELRVLYGQSQLSPSALRPRPPRSHRPREPRARDRAVRRARDGAVRVGGPASGAHSGRSWSRRWSFSSASSPASSAARGPPGRSESTGGIIPVRRIPGTL